MLCQPLGDKVKSRAKKPRTIGPYYQETVRKLVGGKGKMFFSRRMDKKAQKSAEKQDILKPCPLCENRNIKIFTAMGTSISCEKCNLKLYDLDRETAIKRWNRRSHENKIVN